MTSSLIKLKIAKYESQIENNNILIQNAGREFESLSGFKNNVVNYQSNFSVGKNSKLRALEDVYQIADNCNTASRYYAGMNKLINVSGGKIVCVLLEKLIGSIGDSMCSQVKKINHLEAENFRLRCEIENLRQDLTLAEMNESLADANE